MVQKYDNLCFQFIKILYLDKSEQTIYLLARNRTLYFFTRGLFTSHTVVQVHSQHHSPRFAHSCRQQFLILSYSLSLSLFLSPSLVYRSPTSRDLFLSLSLSPLHFYIIILYTLISLSVCEYITLILPKTFALLSPENSTPPYVILCTCSVPLYLKKGVRLHLQKRIS